MHHSLDSASATIPCNLCTGTAISPVRQQDRHGKPLRSVACRACGLVWTDPRPSPEQVREFYEKEYRVSYKASYQPKPKHTFRAGNVALERSQRLQAFLKPGQHVLDVGAGGGELVYVLRKQGYEASGFEPNEGYAKHAAETLGVPVRQGFWQDVSIPAESQDAVTLFHVVEHLESPYDIMCHARQWLKPGGLLVVEVPNVEATCQQPHSQFHIGHIYHFSPTTMEAMHRRAGYEVVHSSTSADGGNLLVISRKTDSPPAAPSPVPGNYERVTKILQGHTLAKHFLSLNPYLRPLRKLASRLAERSHSNAALSAKEVLDGVLTRAGGPT